jgi:hypothetical protein
MISAAISSSFKSIAYILNSLGYNNSNIRKNFILLSGTIVAVLMVYPQYLHDVVVCSKGAYPKKKLLTTVNTVVRSSSRKN